MCSENRPCAVARSRRVSLQAIQLSAAALGARPIGTPPLANYVFLRRQTSVLEGHYDYAGHDERSKHDQDTNRGHEGVNPASAVLIPLCHRRFALSMPLRLFAVKYDLYRR